MRDPYYAEGDARDADMARIRARLRELEAPPSTVPAELDELLNGTSWRRGPVRLADGREVMVKLHGPAGTTTSADILRYLEAPAATSGEPTGRIGPATRRALPRPLAGYLDGEQIVLADWLDKGQSRRVLRTLRGHADAARRGGGERRLLGLVMLPLLLGVRALRDLGQLAAVTPATGTAAATCTSTVTTTMAAAAAPLATAAAIMGTPITLPAAEAYLAPPVRAEAAVVQVAPARADDAPAPDRPPAQTEPGGAQEEADAEPEAAPVPPPAPPPAGPAAAPTPAPEAAPTTSPAPTPAPTQAATPSAGTAPSSKPAPAEPAEPTAEPAAEPTAEPTVEPPPVEAAVPVEVADPAESEDEEDPGDTPTPGSLADCRPGLLASRPCDPGQPVCAPRTGTVPDPPAQE